MDFKKIVLIGGLILTSLFLVQKWNDDYHSEVEKANESTLSSFSTAENSKKAPVTIKGSDAPSRDIPVPVAREDATRGQFVSVDTGTLKVQIDTHGGNVVQSLLPKYPKYQHNSTIPFEILQRDNTRTFVAQSGLAGKNGPDNSSVPIYSVDKTHYQLGVNQKQLVVDLKLRENSVSIVKRYIFSRNAYSVRVQYLVTNNSSKPWQGVFYGQLKRDDSPDPSTQNAATTLNSFLGAAFKTNDDPYKKIKFSNFSKDVVSQEVTGGYAAIVQHYFVTAWVPQQTKRHLYKTRLSPNDTYYFIGFINQPVLVSPGQTHSFEAILYTGPKIPSKLKQLSQGLDLTVDYGWLWWLAQPLFKLLTFIHKIVGNWGWAIILLTVFVKLLLYPLSTTAYKSMGNMRRVGPKIQALKEQYGDDRQKMGQAMMTLYKKEKINPMGGCLPILIQMPVFLALYWVLLESVELRQAPWILWITDLSQKDPYFILPLIMGGTMFLQQFLNPTPPDPMQAKVTKFMPVIFTFFFLWFPSGLVLYWIVNNSLSIVQQWLITRAMDKST